MPFGGFMERLVSCFNVASMFSSVSVQHSKRSHGRSRCKGFFACVFLEVSIRNKTTFASHCSNTFVFQLKYHMRRNRPISLEFSISRVSPLKCSNFKELHDFLPHSSFPKPSIFAPYRLAPRCRLIGVVQKQGSVVTIFSCF